MTDFVTLKKQINDLREEAKRKAQGYFAEGAQGLFEKHPEMVSFSWRQYTPYFNDGDPCIFRAYVDYPDINDEDGDELKWSDDEDVKGLRGSQNEVIAFLQVFDNDDLKNLFGDHVRVTVTRDGVDAESYDHD